MSEATLSSAQEQQIRRHLLDGERPNLACDGCLAWILLGERDAALNGQRLVEAVQAEAMRRMIETDRVLAETRARPIVAEQKLRSRDWPD